MGRAEGKRRPGGYRRIAVTGASGFVGSHLIPALVNAGHEITCAVEPTWNDPIEDAESFPADIATGEGLSAALRGADAVVHLAARNHVLQETANDPLSEYRRVNVEGTRNVMRAAAASGVKWFIHFSSIKAMGESSVDILDEDSPCLPTTPYGISKLESEDVVRAEAEKSAVRAVIIRLPMAYGPRNKGNLPRMIRWADRGLPFPLFQPDNLRSMIYVENVVAGVLALLAWAPEGVSTYILKDGEDCSTRRIYSSVCRELGKTPRFLPVPAAIVRLGGKLSEDFRKITDSFRVSSAKAEREVAFIPPLSVDEGVARTVRWYKRSGH